MRKLRPVSVLAVLIIVGITLTGCTQQQNNNQPQQVTLQWWGVYWDAAVVQPLIDEYQTANSNVKIQYANKWPASTPRTVAEKLYQDELTRVLRTRNALEIPDIFMVDNTWSGKYEALAAPAPTSILPYQPFSTQYYPVVVKDFTRNSNVIGVPLWIDSLAVIYNKDMLAERAVTTPPTNWVDFRNLAIALTQKTGSVISRSGLALGTARNVSFPMEILNVLMLQNGVNMLSSQGAPIFADSPGALSALSFYKEFATVGTGNTWTDTFKQDAAAFLEEDVAMIIAPSWRYNDLLRLKEANNIDINMEVAPLPQLESQNQPAVNWATYWGAMVALDRPVTNTSEAWKFLAWLSQPEQLRKLRQSELKVRDNFGIIYPRTDMATELQTDQFLRVFVNSLATADSWAMVDGLAVKDIFAELIGRTANTTSLNQAQQRVQQVITNKGNL